MKWIYFITIFILSVACQEYRELELPYTPELMETPKGFPEPIIPTDNAFSEARWELGKRLFFDSALSLDSTISCASCHKPGLAFSDNTALSLGVKNRPGTRNTPTLANVAYHPYFTREGGVPTLEMQVLVPIQEHSEFGFNIVLIADRLKQNAEYVSMAKKRLRTGNRCFRYHSCISLL